MFSREFNGYYSSRETVFIDLKKTKNEIQKTGLERMVKLAIQISVDPLHKQNYRQFKTNVKFSNKIELFPTIIVCKQIRNE